MAAAALLARDLDPSLLGSYLRKLRSTRKLAPSVPGVRVAFDCHPLEERVLMSFAPILAGISSVDEGRYSVKVSVTGSEAASAWRIDWGDGLGEQPVTPAADGTVLSPMIDGSVQRTITASAKSAVTNTWSPAVPLSLDAAFRGGGSFTHSLTTFDFGYAMAVQPGDGKILVAGEYNRDFALVRYNPDGSLDTTFGIGESPGNGIVKLNFAGSDDIAYAIALQQDGRIIVAGSARTSTADFAIARFTSEGARDLTFGQGGRVNIPVGSGNDDALAVALQPDGKIIAAGISYTQFSYEFAVIRLTADGDLDNTFSGDGKLTVPFGTAAAAQAIVIQGDGKIVIGGRLTPSQSNPQDIALVRLLTNGDLDTTFNGTGKVTTDFGGGHHSASPYDAAYSLVLQADGKIVAAGESGGDFAVARYNANGSLDSTFDGDGKLTTDFSQGTDRAYAVALQPDNKIVVAGHAEVAAAQGTGYDFAVVRYNANGSLDGTFGTSGKVTTGFGSASTSDMARGVAVLADGRIVVAGYSGSDFALARYLPENRVTVNNVAPTGTLEISMPEVAASGKPRTLVARLVHVNDPSDPDRATLRYSFATSAAGLASSYAGASPVDSQSFVFTSGVVPSIYARVFDEDGLYTEYALTAVHFLVVTSTSDTAVELKYTATVGQRVRLEMAGPGDTNYRDIGDLTPTQRADDYTHTVNNLQNNTPYKFRLKVIDGDNVFYASTFATTSSDAGGGPSDLRVISVTGNVMKIGFTWDPNFAEFNVKVFGHASRLPLPLIGKQLLEQNFVVDQLAGHDYWVDVVVPPYLDHVRLQASQPGYVSGWVTLPLAAQSPPQGPNRALSTSVAGNGDVTFSVGSSFDGSLYWIDADNNVTGTAFAYNGASSVVVAASAIPAGARQAVALWRDDVRVVNSVPAPVLEYSNTLPLPGIAAAIPIAPTDLSATASLDGSGPRVRLAWTNAPGNEDGYVVQRQDVTRPDQGWTDLAIVRPNDASTLEDQTFFTDAPPSTSGLFEYRVLAVSTLGGASPASNVALVRFAPVVSPIAVYHAANTTDSPITLSVTAIGAEGHEPTYKWEVRHPTTGAWTDLLGTPTKTYTPTTSGNWLFRVTVTDPTWNLSARVYTQLIPVVAGDALQTSGATVASESAWLTYAATGINAAATSWTVTRNGVLFAQGAGATFSFLTGRSGDYVVQATASGAQADAISLKVVHVKPAVTISGPPVGFAGKSMTFTAHVDWGPAGTNPVAYTWTLQNAAGTTYTANATGAALHVPDTLPAGDYQLKLTVAETHEGVTGYVAQQFGFKVLPVPTGAADFDWGAVSLLETQSISTFQSGNFPQVMMRQSDGKILVAGGTYGRFESLESIGRAPGFIARFNADMTLDSSFGQDRRGTTLFDFVEEYDAITSAVHAMAIDPDNGKVVIAGTVWTPLGSRLSVARFVSQDTVAPDGRVVLAGSFDPTFNSGEPFVLENTSTVSQGFSVVIQDTDNSMADEPIFIGGAAAAAGYVDDFLLVKLTSAGQLDTTFNSTGVAQQPDVTNQSFPAFGTGPANSYWPSDWSPTWGAQSLLIVDGGKLLAAGSARRGPDVGFSLVRYTIGGLIDTTFGSSGQTFTSSDAFNPDDPYYPVNNSHGLALLRSAAIVNSEIVTVGVAASQHEFDHVAANTVYAAVARYSANGTLLAPGVTRINALSTTFEQIGLTPRQRTPYAFAFQPDGKIVGALLNGGTDWDLVRINPNSGTNAATPDMTFDPGSTDGRLDIPMALPISAGWEGPSMRTSVGLLVTDDGILAAGELVQTCDSTTVITRYRATPKPAARNLMATAKPASVTLTWTNSGFGQDGFEIRRALTSTDLDLSGALIGVVGPEQNDFVDATVAADTLYYYKVVPRGGSSLTAPLTSVRTYPVGANYVLKETVAVPVGPTAGAAQSTSTTVLQAGQSYLLVASGLIHVTPDGGGAAEFVADAAYWYSADRPSVSGRDLAGSRFGISVNHGATAPVPGNVPDWGLSDPAHHTYAYVVTGQGSTLTFRFHDAYYGDNSAATGDTPLKVEIYALNATPPSQASPVRQILSPGDAAVGVPPVIGSNTAINIISADPDGSTTPWALWLVSGQVCTPLATGSTSAGQLPRVGKHVTTLDPAQYPDGLYTLRLTASQCAPGGSEVIDEQTILIQTANKAGNFSLPVTDATFDTPLGPMSVTRIYYSSRAGQQGLLGHGWTLGMLDAQLRTTARADTQGNNSSLDALRAGDLVYLTVPSGGQHVFEFAPIAVSETQKYNGGYTGLQYLPRFVAVDGSGATLIPRYTTNTITYDPVHDEYLGGYAHWSGHFAYRPGQYQLITKDGTSYIISPVTGRISEIIDASGNTLKFDEVGPNTITLGVVLNWDPYTTKTLLTIRIKEVNDLDLIESIEAPDKPPIYYKYDDAENLITVQNQAGEKTLYAYQSTASPHYVSGVTNARGATVLQAQYDETNGHLLALMNAKGQTIPTGSMSLGTNTVIETVTDPAGNVTQNVYDQRYGTLLRRIQSVTDAGGLRYIVTVRRYDYVINDLDRTTSRAGSGLTMLRSVEDYAPFEVAGPDAGGVRYSHEPAADSWIRRTVFNTSATLADVAWKQVLSVSERIHSDGTLRTTRYEAYKVLSDAKEIVKPQVVTVIVQTPNGTGYDDHVQSKTFTVYNGDGTVSYSVTALDNLPDGQGFYKAQGTEHIYDGYGRIYRSYNVTVSIKLDQNGNIEHSSNLGEGIEQVGGPLTTNDHYWDHNNPRTGVPYGSNWRSTNAAGEVTYYARDPQGRPVLTYTLKNLPSGFAGLGYTTSSTSQHWVTVSSKAFTVQAGLAYSPGQRVIISHDASSIMEGTIKSYSGTSLMIDVTYVRLGQGSGPFTDWEIDLSGKIWVGTSQAYDKLGQLIASYEGAYWDSGNGELEVAHAEPGGTPIALAGNLIGYSTHGRPRFEVNEAGVYAPLVRTVLNEYNAARQLVSSTDQYGGVTSTTYDGNGRVIRVVYPDKTEVRTVYDELGRDVWKTDRFLPVFPADPNNQSNVAVATRTVYSSLGQVVETKRFSNVRVHITTVAQGSLPVAASVTSNEAQLTSPFSTTKTWYDEQGRAIETRSASGLRTGTVYYPDGRMRYTGELDANAPEGGAVTPVAGAPSGVQARGFDTSHFFNNPSSPDLYTENGYDLYDTTLNRFYDRVKDANDNITRTYKDALGREIRVVFDDNSFTETRYSYGKWAADATGLTPPTQDEGWTWGIQVPTGGSEVVKIAQRAGGQTPVSTHYVYDISGQLIHVWLPAVDDATTPSSALVRPQYSYVYDASGNQIVEVTPRQQGSTTLPGSYRHWLAQSNLPQNFTGATQLRYDHSGRQISRTLPAVNSATVTETWTYDTFGRVATHTDYKGQGTRYVYDNTPQRGGFLLEEERFDAAVDATPDEETIYTYDGLGRTKTVTEYEQLDADPELDVSRAATTYTYSSIDGQITLVDSPEGKLYYAYNSATGLLTDTWTGNSSTFSATTHTIYGYDMHGRLASVTAAQLNGLNQPNPPSTNRYTAIGTTVSAEGPTTFYTYDAVGNLDTVTLANGVLEDYDYDDLNRLVKLTASKAGDRLFQQDYALESDGQRDYVIEQRFSGSPATPYSKVKIDWTYDDQNRLIAETRDADTTPGNASDDFGTRDSVPGDYTDTFAYDLGSNRAKKNRGWDNNGDGLLDSTDSGQAIDYTYNARDQLVTEVASTATTTYVYDNNGSMTSETTGANVTLYTWDLRNRMAAVDAPGTANDATYAYDHDGVRVKRTVNGVTTTYLNDAENPTGYTKAIEERTGSSTGPLYRSYVIGHDLIAQVDPAETPLYFLKDGRGTTRALLTDAGAVVTGQTFDFDAFSTLLGATTPDTEWLAADGRRDTETGFTYSLARYRDAWRFVSMDDPRFGNAIDPQSLHKYLYAHADPVHGDDPSGHFLNSAINIGLHHNLAEQDGGFDILNSNDASWFYGPLKLTFRSMMADFQSRSTGRSLADDAFALAGLHDTMMLMEVAGLQEAVNSLLGVAEGERQRLIDHFMNPFTYLDVTGLAIGVGMRYLFKALRTLRPVTGVMRGGCFLAGTPVLLAGEEKAPIEAIRVGQRVATDGGLANSADGKTMAADPSDTRVNPETWRLITIEADDWQIQTLVPLDWIKSHEIVVEGSVRLVDVIDVAEMGAPEDLVGTVQAISRAPKIESGPGRVVLTTASHLSDFVYDLTLTDRQESTDNLGVTGHHRFYSENRGWVTASELHLGETLRTADGNVTVTSLQRQEGVHRVYNMTIESDHVYYVGDLTALVHNACAVEGHHVFPQDFRGDFARAGIDVDDYVMPLATPKHRLRSGNGIHTGPYADSWNGRWEAFFRANAKPTQIQIWAHLDEMFTDFGI